MHQARKIEAETQTANPPDEWAVRCRYWFEQYEASIPKRKRRERQAHPLILTGNGLSLRVNRGSLVIKDGLTHYPQEKNEYRLFPGQLENPPRIVLVDGSGEITLDALDWLAEQDIPLIRLKWDGSFVSVVTSNGQAADQDKVRWQHETRHDPIARLEFAYPLITEKARNTLETLEGWVPDSSLKSSALKTATRALEKVEAKQLETLSDLLGQEGVIAGAYFRAWEGIELKWVDTDKHPIPDDWRTYRSRAALREEKPQNRHATHPVNAMLNYVYAQLCSSKQIEAIAEGYDPMAGIVHDRRKRVRGITPAFALDIMEPERPIVDRRVLEMLREHELAKEDFVVTSKGTCRAGPDLARHLIGAIEAAEL